MALDKENVRGIARLARLKLAETELDRLAGELNNIVAWVEQLDSVDTDNVAPMTSVADMVLPQRDDVVTDGGYADQVLGNAPDRVGDFYAVPKVVE